MYSGAGAAPAAEAGGGGGVAAAAAVPAAPAPRAGILREVHALVVGFFTSLLPGYAWDSTLTPAQAQAHVLLCFWSQPATQNVTHTG